MSWHRTSSGRRPLLAVVLDPPPYRLEPAFILRLAFLPLRSRLNYSPALTPCSQHGFNHVNILLTLTLTLLTLTLTQRLGEGDWRSDRGQQL